MCEKAKEIQELWIPQNGDEIFDTLDYKPWIISLDDGWKPEIDDIWLPRQDQLQDMVTYSVWFEKLYRFYDWLQKENYNPTKWITFSSIEQLWLAFVMKEKYLKEWNEKDWVKK